jgi:hypothetical protein
MHERLRLLTAIGHEGDASKAQDHHRPGRRLGDRCNWSECEDTDAEPAGVPAYVGGFRWRSRIFP